MELSAIVRGDYEEIEVEVYNPPDDEHPEMYPRDIRNDTLTFRAKLNSKDANAVFTKSSTDSNQIEKVDGLNGRALIKVYPADTMSVPSSKTLKCTLEVVDYLDRPATTFHDLPVTWRYI